MASRWMVSVQARQRSYRKRLGNLSFTDEERRFYRRKIKINPDTGRIVSIESIDDHITRMETIAAEERIKPKIPYRVFARIQSIPSIREIPLEREERELVIRNMYKDEKLGWRLKPDVTLAYVEQAILRWRRLTNRKARYEEDLKNKVSWEEIQLRRKKENQERVRNHKNKENQNKEQNQNKANPNIRTFSFKS